MQFGHLPKDETTVNLTNSTGYILENWLFTLNGNQINHTEDLKTPTVCSCGKKTGYSWNDHNCSDKDITALCEW